MLMHLAAIGRNEFSFPSVEDKYECEDAVKKSEEILNLELNSQNVSIALNYYLSARQIKSDLLQDKCKEFIQNYFTSCFANWEKTKDLAHMLSQFAEQEKQIMPLSLDLNNRKKLRSDFFEMLKWFSDFLISLKLNSPHICLTDEDLKHISPFIHLNSLSLNCKIQSDGLFHLKALTKLIALKLRLSSQSRENKKLEHLQSLTNLTYLNLSESEINDKDVACLQPFTRLTTLKLNGCQLVTKVGLNSLSHLPLTSLNVGGDQWRLKSSEDAGIDIFQQFSSLISLRVNRTAITDTELEKLHSVQNLTFLDLSDNPFLKDRSIVYLEPLTALTSLALNNCPIQGWGLKSLKPLTNLRSLSLKENEFAADYDLSYLLTHLSSLNLANCKKIRNSGSANLAPLTNLTFLNVSGCGINDEGVKNLQANSHLRALDLSGCAITDDGLENLKTLSNLTKINLSNCEFITQFALNFINNHVKFNFLRIQHSRRTVMAYSVQNTRNPSMDSSLGDWGVIHDDTDLKEKVDVLFRQNELLLNQINKLKQESEENKQLKVNQQELVYKVNELSKQVFSSDKQIQELKEENKQLKENADALYELTRKEVLQKDAKIQELSKKIESLEKNIQDQEDTIKQNTEKLQKETQLKAKLEEKLAEKEKLIENTTDTNGDLIKELKDENEQLNIRLDQNKARFSKIEEKLGANTKNMTTEEVVSEIDKLQSQGLTKNEKIAGVAIPVLGAAVGCLGGPVGALIGGSVGVLLDGGYLLINK